MSNLTRPRYVLSQNVWRHKFVFPISVVLLILLSVRCCWCFNVIFSDRTILLNVLIFCSCQFVSKIVMFDYEAFILFCHCISTASASGFSGLFTSVLTGLVVQCLLFLQRIWRSSTTWRLDWRRGTKWRQTHADRVRHEERGYDYLDLSCCFYFYLFISFSATPATQIKTTKSQPMIERLQKEH